MDKTVLNKNIWAMQGEHYVKLKARLEKMSKAKNPLTKWEYFYEGDKLNVQIKNKKSGKGIYDNPIGELNRNIKNFEELRRYPVLFFYGMGNGILYKALLQNEYHKNIVIFESEIELIYIALSILDFSEDILNARFIMVLAEFYDEGVAGGLCHINAFSFFFKTYFLTIHSRFYKEHYEEEIERVNEITTKMIVQTTLKRGNDPRDALQGIEQFIANIPHMVKRPTINELSKKRKYKSETAIIVATGPSLRKQLPQLKKVADRATIFCVDSAFPILAAEGIRPDYVCMLERDDTVCECFNNNFGEDYERDITFIVMSLVHRQSVKYLLDNKRHFMAISRGQPYCVSVGLNEWGYITGGMSVSHTASELAVYLGHKKIIFIGQDLAYADDGRHHAEGFLHDDWHVGDYERDFDQFRAPAYGGKGVVQSSRVWSLFRAIFEDYIKFWEGVDFYNATEGGSRIAGTTEWSFKKCCEKLLPEKLKKPFFKLKPLPLAEQNKQLLAAYKKIKKNQATAEQLVRECKRAYKYIQSLTRKKQIYTPEEVIAKLDALKDALETPKYYFLQELITPSLFHHETQLSPLYLKDFKDENEKDNKMLAFIYSHEAWLEELVGLIWAQERRVKYAIVPLREELERRGVL